MPFPTPEVSTDIIFESFPVGPLQCNCAIVGDKISKRCLIIDPGGDADKILDLVDASGLDVIGIIHTHAHLDHILASAQIQRRTGAPLALHQADKFLWDALGDQCARFGIEYDPTPAPDHWLGDEELLDCCGGVVIHTPGHTPGSLSFWFPDHDLLIAGDTLFQMGIGRTDLPGGSFDEIEVSITQRLFRLADDALVITGHGPRTSLAFERQANPFFGGIG